MSQPTDKPVILCVDDEARVMESLALHLRRDYQIHTALSGEEGLRKLKSLGNVAVVLSDMRMPVMDGAKFLKRVMELHPETVRMVLTGDAGREAAALAINEGQIFRFLTKPCPPDQLRTAIDAALVQHRLITAERLLMQQTVVGCIHALVDVLAMTNPVAFGRASRLKRQVVEFAEAIGARGFWQLEAATMLSQLGYLALPGELVEKLYDGQRLTPAELALAEGVPRVANKLLGHIPRLEPVLQILNAVTASDEQLASLGESTIGLGARMLGLVLQYDTVVAQGMSSDVAMQTVRARSARHGVVLVEQFASMLGAAAGTADIREIPLRMVQPGMTVMHDLRTQQGTLLIPRGFEVSESFLHRLRNLGAHILAEKVKVIVHPLKAATPASGAGEIPTT